MLWLGEGERHVGFTDYHCSDTNSANGTWHNITDRFTPPEDMYFVQVLVAVRGSSSGSTEYATARWDDIRLTVADAVGFQIVAAVVHGTTQTNMVNGPLFPPSFNSNDVNVTSWGQVLSQVRRL